MAKRFLGGLTCLLLASHTLPALAQDAQTATGADAASAQSSATTDSAAPPTTEEAPPAVEVAAPKVEIKAEPKIEPAATPSPEPSASPVPIPSASPSPVAEEAVPPPSAGMTTDSETGKLVDDLTISDSAKVIRGQEMVPGATNLDPRPKAKIQGTFTRKDWTIQWSEGPVTLDKKGRFEITVPIVGPETTVEWLLKGPDGSEQKATSIIRVPGWHKLSGDPDVRLSDGSTPGTYGARKNALWFGARFGSYSYTETKSPTASELALSLDVLAKHKFTPKWDGRLLLNFTALPLGGTPEAFKFFSASILGGYTALKDSVNELQIIGGLRSLQMMVSSGDFGFSGAYGLRLIPLYTRKLANGAEASGFFSVSPVSNYFGVIPSGKNMELVIGGGYKLPPSAKRRQIILNLEFSSLTLDIEGIAIQSSAITAGATYPIY